MPKQHPFDWLEQILLGIVVVGIIGSAVTQQIIYGMLPLILYLPINYLNRSRIYASLSSNPLKLSLTSLDEQTQENSQKIEAIEQKITSNPSYLQVQQQLKNQLDSKTEDIDRKITQFQQTITQLSESLQTIKQENNKLYQTKFENVEQELKLIQENLANNSNHKINLDPLYGEINLLKNMLHNYSSDYTTQIHLLRNRIDHFYQECNRLIQGFGSNSRLDQQGK